jgi:hypothetical protein
MQLALLQRVFVLSVNRLAQPMGFDQPHTGIPAQHRIVVVCWSLRDGLLPYDARSSMVGTSA